MTTHDDDLARADGERLSDRQDLPRPASGSFAAIDTNDVRHAAAGNLAFLLSVIRSGEQLTAEEEFAIRKTIDRLLAGAIRDLDNESWVRQRLRQELWFGHGCGIAALYGDDGEMQCHACHVDFKREPLDEIVPFVERRRLTLAADALKEAGR